MTTNLQKRITDSGRIVEAVEQAFGGAVGDKHVGPGVALRNNGRIFAHNASVLSGSSGSAVVDSSSLKFVGIRKCLESYQETINMSRN